MKSKLNFFIVLGAFLVLALVSTQLFSIVGNNEVWIPQYGSVSCSPTRLDCFPGDDCALNSNDVGDWENIDNGGASYWCGEGFPPFSNADFYEGCNFYVEKVQTNTIDLTEVSICDADGSNCLNRNVELGNSFWGDAGQTFNINWGKKLYVNPTGADYKIRGVSQVYGILVNGAVKPSFSDYCNVASLLNADQVMLLEDDPAIVQVLADGEISPQNYPVVFITGYGLSFSDTRIIERDGDSWFIEDIGVRCLIKQDTSGRFVVSDECVNDNSIECFPGIGNCNSDGQLSTFDDLECVPGTLIGSNTRRQPIGDEACKISCSDSGDIVYYDCVDIVSCVDGEVLNQNYECVDRLVVDEEQLCILQGGKWREYMVGDEDVFECDYSNDNTLVYVVLGVVFIVLLMFVVKKARGKK